MLYDLSCMSDDLACHTHVQLPSCPVAHHDRATIQHLLGIGPLQAL